MIAFMFAAALAAAQPAAGDAAAQPAAKPAKADKDAMVCKREAVVGSRMKTRICLTQAEWDARAVAAKEEVDAAQRNQSMRGN